MTLSHEQIKKELKVASIKFSDATYVLPSFDYITKEFLPWFAGYIARRGMIFAKEKFDCDDFAHEFASRLREAGLQLREKAGVAVAIIQVRNKENSLGIPAGEHMLNLVGVNTKNGHGWLVIEPQNQKYVFLQDYKSADNLRVSF